MALGHNPTIVTSDLVLCLDAANPRSYPGSGSIWYDISGNGNNFTLYNAPTFSNGALSFDGVNEYAASTNNINLTSYTSITAEVWFKASTTGDSMVIEHTSNWNTQTGGWGLYINSTGSTPQANLMHTNHNTEEARNYDFTIGTNWNNQTNIFSRISDSTGRLTYCNGNLTSFASGAYGTSTTTIAGGSFANAILYLASRGGTAAYYNGSISLVKIYGTKLTADQVSTNFNAIRSRYNI